MSARLKTWNGGLGKKKKEKTTCNMDQFSSWVETFERENNHVLEMMCGHVSLSLKWKNAILCYYPFEP